MLALARADAQLTTLVPGGFHRKPPPGVASVFGIIRQETSSSDLYGFDGEGGAPIWVPLIFQANVYDRNKDDYTRLEPAARRIHAVMHGQTVSTPDGTVFGCRRIAQYADEEVLGDAVELFINQKYEIYTLGE